MEYKPSDSLPYQLTAINSMLSGGLDEMVGTLSDEHFGDERALTIWNNCKKMRLSGYEVTPQSVRDFVMAEAGDADAAALVDEAVNSPLVSPALAVRTLTTMRARQLASELGKYLVSQDAAKDGVEAVVSKIARFSMSYSVITSEQYQTLGDFMANIDKPGDKPLIITPGFGDIDKHLRFYPGTMNLLAAAPGVGKTATLLNMAVNAAYQGHNSLIISLEMPEFAINARLTAIIAGVSAFNVREKCLTKEEVAHILAVRESYDQIISKIHVIAPAKMQVDSLLPVVNKWKQEKDVKIVYADYLQLWDAPGKSEYDKVTHISEVVKQTSKLVNIPLVPISSTRRRGKDETGGPSMHDLRSSGKLEFDSNTISVMTKDKENKNILHLDIVKNREGAQMGCDLYHDFVTHRIRANEAVPFTPKPLTA